jgi:hypothetical protein
MYFLLVFFTQLFNINGSIYTFSTFPLRGKVVRVELGITSAEDTIFLFRLHTIYIQCYDHNASDLACAKFDQVLATAARAAREISMIAFCCSIKLAIL